VIRLFGPKIATVIFDEDKATGVIINKDLPGLDVSHAKTVKQALDIYSKALQVDVKPYDGSFPDRPLDKDNLKYFICEYNRGDQGPYIDLVDIHVQRGDEEICIKQNLDFELRDGDIVDLGAMAC